jgi:hypothetical protein
MNTAVVTICCGSFFERLASITHPTIEAYARRLGADFIVWREFAGHTMPHYQKLELGRLLERYDRVLYLDTDVLVRDDAPDLFGLVPEGELGMLLESEYVDRRIDVIQYMIAVGYDARAWDGKYYNAGVMVLSPCHRDLFTQPTSETNHIKEQTYLNLMISRTRTKMFPLPYRFNRMYFMDWLYGEDRCDCYLIHYAGLQLIAAEDEYLKIVAADRAAWERAKPDYRFARHVAFVLQGAVGDQIAAEPAIRYARDVLYKGDRLAIVSSYPRLFSHLGLPTYPALDQVPEVNRYMPCYNRANPARPPLAIDPRGVHAVDVASLNMLGIELPMAYRRPMVPVDPAARAAVGRKLGPRAAGELVVIHAGPGGQGSCDDGGAWRSLAHVVVKSGHKVAVIGNRGQGEFAAVDFDASGCLDLVDQLSLDETIALVSEARVLLTNDSPVVPIAGAFDGWIGLVAAGRHPDYVLPWRNGSQSWRAASFQQPGQGPAEASALRDFVRCAFGDGDA